MTVWHPRPITPVGFNWTSTRTTSGAVWRLPSFCPPRRHRALTCPWGVRGPGIGQGWRAAVFSPEFELRTPRRAPCGLRGAPPAARAPQSSVRDTARRPPASPLCASFNPRVTCLVRVCVPSACALSSVLTVRGGVLPIPNQCPEETSRPGERAKPAWGGSDLRHYLGTVFRVSV